MKDFIEQRLEENKRFVINVLGDSITWGENHCTSDETYCACLARLFAREFPKCAVYRYDGIVESESNPLSHFSESITVQEGNVGEIVIIRNGIGGNTVRRALNRKQDFAGECVHGCYPDMFLMMYGINDALKNDPSKYVTADKFYDNYLELYDLLTETNPTARLVIMTPSFNDEGISRESVLDKYCEMIKRLASEKNCRLIGQLGDTTPATFYGAVWFLMNFLKTEYTDKTIVFMAPAHRVGDREVAQVPEKLPDALPLAAYVDIIIETAKQFDIPVLNMYEKLGIDPTVDEDREKYTTDGVHFNSAGHERIANVLKDFLERL